MIVQNPVSEKAISVTELNATIAACMDSPIFKGLEVFGEVSGGRVTGGHFYFTLKDKDSEIQCVRFYAASSYIPKDGESVVLRGELNFWTKKGKVNFKAREIVPAGKGLLAIQFEKMKAKLAAEGLFDKAHKVPIPKYPKTVLVVTSKTGAVIRDIVTTVRRKNPVIDIVVRDVRVQGDGAAHEIAGVLARVDKLGFDVVILARGGGSLEDLAPFYDEELVRAIYSMCTPVISAVGHETDLSLADLVADERAATPTAAAELVAYDYNGLLKEVTDCAEKMRRAVRSDFDRKLMRVRGEGEKLGRLMVSFRNKRERRLLNAVTRLEMSVGNKLRDAESKVTALSGKLDALSPLKVLSRGYFNVQAAGRSVTSVRRLKKGDIVTVRGSDGSFTATVDNVMPEDGRAGA